VPSQNFVQGLQAFKFVVIFRKYSNHVVVSGSFFNIPFNSKSRPCEAARIGLESSASHCGLRHDEETMGNGVAHNFLELVPIIETAFFVPDTLWSGQVSHML
jgi:hypothetical protein